MTNSTVRIIAGKWRGKRILFPLKDSLRPTQDRVRETVFNWLMTNIVGSNCLDLFTGTGVFALESLSRGADHVTAIDCDKTLIDSLKKNAKDLDTHDITLIQSDYKKALLSKAPFGIVFIDPPFESMLQVPVACWLEENRLLLPNAKIYMEAKKGTSLEELPKNWQCLKQSSTATIDYYLFSSL